MLWRAEGKRELLGIETFSYVYSIGNEDKQAVVDVESKSQGQTYKTWWTATSRNSSSTAVASCKGSSCFMVAVLCCMCV